MNANLSKKVAFQNSSIGRLVDNNPEEEKEPNMYRQEDAAKAPRPCGWSFALKKRKHNDSKYHIIPIRNTNS
jgi:hypothetical protein